LKSYRRVKEFDLSRNICKIFELEQFNEKTTQNNAKIYFNLERNTNLHVDLRYTLYLDVPCILINFKAHANAHKLIFS